MKRRQHGPGEAAEHIPSAAATTAHEALRAIAGPFGDGKSGSASSPDPLTGAFRLDDKHTRKIILFLIFIGTFFEIQFKLHL